MSRTLYEILHPDRLAMTATPRRPGRPVTTGRSPVISTTVTAALLARLDAVLDPGESRSSVASAALSDEVGRREALR